MLPDTNLGTKDAAFAKSKILSAIFLAFMIIGSVGLDQITKYHAQVKLMKWTDERDPGLYQGERNLLLSIGNSNSSDTKEQYLSFSTNYVRNLGAAWGTLATLPSTVRAPFFYLVTCLAVIIIGIYMKSTPIAHRLVIFSLSLILSGAIGNFIDRVRLGFVIDFIDVRWNLLGWRYDFPNFNFADSAISVGVAFMIWDMMVLESVRRKRGTAAPEQRKKVESAT